MGLGYKEGKEEDKAIDYRSNCNFWVSNLVAQVDDWDVAGSHDFGLAEGMGW